LMLVSGALQGMDLPESDPRADAIAEPARVERRATYEDALDEFESRNYTYVPLPEDGEYYHVTEGWFGEFRDEQVVAPDTHLLDVLEILREAPFVLVDYGAGASDGETATRGSGRWAADGSGRGDPDAETAGPGSDDGDPNGRYGIVTVSDVNKRPTHEMVYPVVAELAALIARRIEDRYDSRELFDRLDDRTVGSWVKDERRDVELHVAESMDLGEMESVLRRSAPELAKSCGFRSTDELDELAGIRNLRNRVMHANRSLVRHREEIGEMLDTIEEAAGLIERANTGAAFE